MITAIRRVVACMTLLLPFEAMASDTSARKSASEQPAVTQPEDCKPERPCGATPAPRPAAKFDFGLLLPKVPQMPSACRMPRQYRSINPDKSQRQPCFYA